jgi:signal transduction histidine kinase/CheY-like chemotaxis protein
MIEINKNQTLDAMLHQILNQALVEIRAEAGSLMLVDNDQKLLQIKARLGKPREGRKSEPVFKLDHSSVAGHAAITRKPYVCKDINDPNERFFRPSRTGTNFSSIISVPVVFGDETIAVINADAQEPNHFTDKNLKDLLQVADDASGPISEKYNITYVISDIGMDLIRLTEGDAELLLKKIAEAAVKTLGADVITLYQYNQKRDEFLVEGIGPTVAGSLRYPEYMRTRVYDTDVPYIFIKKRESGFYANVSDIDVLSEKIPRKSSENRPRFIEREGIESMAALLLPYRAAKDPNQEIVGIIFANYREPHEFLNIDERLVLATFADFASATILNSRLEKRRTEERVALVSSLSAGLAHRMSKLFAPSRLAVQYLRKKFPKEDEVTHDLLSQIEQQANLLFAISEKIAERFKTSGTPHILTPLKVKDEVEKVISQYHNDLNGIKILTNFPRNLPYVKCDANQLPLVIGDILTNSIEAIHSCENSPKNSHFTISIEAVYSSEISSIELEITDNGCGVSFENRNEIFLPGKGTKETLGIGLWWCQTFLNSIGGDLYLKNPQPEIGCTIVIRLPIYRELQKELSSEKTLSEQILIIDDDPSFIQIIRAVIEGKNHQVAVAKNWDEAKEAINNFEFPVIILDISLTPSGDDRQGLDVLTLLQEQSVNTKVIVSTAHEKFSNRSLFNKYFNFEDIFLKTNGHIDDLSNLIDSCFSDFKQVRSVVKRNKE